MRGRLTALAAVVSVVVPGAATAAVPSPQAGIAADGGIGVRLVDAGPVTGDPRVRSYIIDRLVPGATIRRRIEISNTTAATVQVAVYPAGANLQRGLFAFASGRRGQNELSRWTSVSGALLRVKPGTTAIDTVTVRVPKKVSSGSRYAVVWAELSGTAPSAGGVRLVNRVGVRMYVTVGSRRPVPPGSNVQAADRTPSSGPTSGARGMSDTQLFGAVLVALLGAGTLAVARVRRRSSRLKEPGGGSQRATAERAYAISLRQDAGSPEENWLRAERELTA
jgi:hypothetical protein